MTLTRALARPAVAATVLTCVAALALAGCTDQPKDTANRPAASTSSGTPSAAADESTDASPTETATTESSASTDPEPTTDATADGTGDDSSAGLSSRLLTAAELPGFNQEYRWSGGTTREREPKAPFGTCQRFAMTSIGATAVAVRTFTPPAGAEATDQGGELVAEFPDSTTARRAFAVLTSWRKKCADQLTRYDRSAVGALEGVGVPGGTGGWYLLTYAPVPGDPDAGFFDAQGMALVGSRIAMVELILAGQDYNYEPGQEPMVTAVKRAAAKLS